MELTTLRQQHPIFTYKSYSSDLNKQGDLTISFEFVLEPDIIFKPRVTIHNVSSEQFSKIDSHILDNYIFHLGLVEMISYWKSACSPVIRVEAGYLDEEQIAWWKDLFIQGLGEFFYVNNIDFTDNDFLQITSDQNKKISKPLDSLPMFSKENIMVPLGGGKDSIVTLRLLQKSNKKISCFVLNTTPATDLIIKEADIKKENSIYASRLIDPKLIELNKKGYLNGHTPFSAYLAFLTTLCGVIFEHSVVAVSNERSSNEGTALFHEVMVNHQYSKSFEFETVFRKYVKTYLDSPTHYLSFLRPLYELQIAQLFSQEPTFFPLFHSCNVGRGKEWCHECPKCIFVYMTLYPFLSYEQIRSIFPKFDLFEKESLLDTVLALIGKKEAKPFECVGTIEESLVALHLAIKKCTKEKRELPFILHKINETVLTQEKDIEKRTSDLLEAWDYQNHIPSDLSDIVHKAIRSI